MKKLLIPLIAVTVCSCVGRFRSPEVEVPANYLYGAEFNPDTVNIGLQWWENFGDTTLNRLVETAIANNRDLQVAYSRIEQARQNIGAVRSQFLPSLSFDAAAKADYTEASGIGQSYSVQPALSWEISLFGTAHHTTEAARAQFFATEWAYRGVMLSLAAEVATTYFSLLQYMNSLRIARETYRLRYESTALIDSLFRYGMYSAVDLQQARSLAAQAAVDIPAYERAVAQTALSLDVLLGRNPQAYRPDPADSLLLTAKRLLPDIPIGLPSALLQRRPDIVEAYYNAMEAHARMGIARAAQFPSLSLTGQGGLFGTTIGEVNNLVWSAAASLTEPIFAFGQKRKNFRMAREENLQAILTYQQTVINAFSDVEKALAAIATYRRQAERYAGLLDAAADIRAMTRQLYLNGLTDYLEVIDAERTYYSSQLDFVSIRAERLQSYVQLYKALGGGW